MNSIGYVGLYGLLRWHDTHRIHELIEHHDRSDYKNLILPVSVYENQSDDTFIKLNDHEFRYHGEMYDIVSQKRVGNAIHFVVIQDNKDERNFHRLAVNTHLQTQSPKTSGTNKTTLLDVIVKSFLTFLYVPNEPANRSEITGKNVFNAKKLTLPRSPFLRVPVPPPKFPEIII